jgi:hypothetical protein
MYIIDSDEWHQKAEDWEELKYLIERNSNIKKYK